ncbi:MAG: 3-oxoacyl-ACP reductase FabG [Candidatus Babeliales bacterium]|jgi:3-oxoacyl-[acyl-carrier protein] reductase|nr:MAG: 3-oxoacyl-(Acyl-carrier-protein) reductase [candidate division TM6 bacterium GW2011_GWF2_36_6]
MAQFNSLVTGGVQGIGFAVAKNLLLRGDRVFVFDYLPENAQIVQKLKDLNIQYFQVDVSSVGSIKNGFDQLSKILENQLNKDLNLLVNNAGVTRDTLAIRMNESDWDTVLDVNLKGTFFCSQQALKRMIKQSKSYIINISSIVGLHGNAGQANYAASKAGIIALTKTLAQEYASRNVLINSIAPGFIQTTMTDKLPESAKQMALEHIALKRFGHPDDVANLIDFLTSGRADYITGQTIELTGGMI